MNIPKALQNSAIYTIILVLQKGISFLLLPIYTFFLSPADYGILGVVSSISGLLSVLISLGVGGAASRFYYLHKEDKEYHRRLYGTIALVIIFNSISFGCIFLLGHRLFIDPIIGTIDFYPFILIGLLTAIVTPLYTFFQEYLQTIQDGKRYGINSIVFFFLNVSFILLSLYVLKLGVLGVLLSNLCTSLLFLIYVVIAFIPRQLMRLDKSILKGSLRYSLPLLPHQLANWSNGTLDKLLVNGIRSQSDAGLYNLSQQYGSVISFISNGVNQAYLPWFYDMVNKGPDSYLKIKQVSEAAVWGVSSIALVFAIFSKEILGLMIQNPAYSEVWMIVPCVAFAYVFQLIYFFYVNVLFLKDTKYIFTITISSVVVNVLLNLLFIPLYGFVGCALACVCTFFIKSVLSLVISRKRNKEILFSDFSMYISAFFAFGLSLTSLFCARLSFGVCMALKSLICGLFVVLVYSRFRKQFKLLVRRFLLHN